MKDETIICACGIAFIWSAREQDFYKSKGFLKPKKCPVCRQEKKNSQASFDGRPGHFKDPYEFRKERVFGKDKKWSRGSGPKLPALDFEY